MATKIAPKVTSTIKRAAPVVRPAAVKPLSTPKVAPRPVTSTIRPTVAPKPVVSQVKPTVAPKPVVTKPVTPAVKPVTSTLKPVTPTVKPTAPKAVTPTKTPVTPPVRPTPSPPKPVTSVVKTPTATPKVPTPTVTPKTTVTNPVKSTSNAAKNTILGTAVGMGANALFNKLGQNAANKIIPGTTTRPTVTTPRPAVTTPRSTATTPRTPTSTTSAPIDQTTEVTNPSLPGQEGYGWKYYSDGTAISPTGEYYKDGQLVWSPTTGTADATTTDTSTQVADTSGSTLGADAGDTFYTDAAGNIYDGSGALIYSADTSGGDQTVADTSTTDQSTGDGQYYTDASGNVYDGSGNLYYDASADTYNTSNQDTTVADNTDYSNVDNTDYSSSDIVESANGGFIDLLYKKGGGVRKMADGGPIDNGDGTYTYDNGDGTYTTVDDQGNELYMSDASGYYTPQDYYGLTSDTTVATPTVADSSSASSPDVNAGRTQMEDGTYMEDDGSGTMYYYDANGNWLYSTDYNNQPTAFSSADGSTVYYDNQGQPFTYDNSGQVQYYDPSAGTFTGGGTYGGGTTTGGTRTLTPNIVQQGGNQQGQNSMLSTLKDFASNNAGAGVIGALIGNLMSQGSTSTGGVNEGVDMSQLAAMQNTGGSGISLGGARDTGAGAYVPYEQYAYWNPQNQQQLYSDLGVSGYGQQPADQYFQDDQGNYYDAQGNPVDMGASEQPQEQAEAPQFADGGSTYFTYGKPVSPADNLGGMKKGGLSQAHTQHSHHTNPIVEGRIDFRQGSAVNGAGDGQSDDIPAMLADGEYVIDADTVAQLGNGSNKAGAKILDKFREEIRAHKRSAPVNKIPPKSKSPLAYLKEAMNG